MTNYFRVFPTKLPSIIYESLLSFSHSLCTHSTDTLAHTETNAHRNLLSALPHNFISKIGSQLKSYDISQ